MFTTERGLRALRHSTNVADTAKYGPSYCRRLEKYSGRGFGIGIPGYVPERITTIARSSYVYILKYDMLFKVSAREPHGKKYRVRGKTLEVVESTQRGVVVRDLERLVVQHECSVFLRHVDVPAVWMCHEHGCMNAEDARKTGSVLAVSSGVRDEYTLLWGAGEDESDSEGSHDDDDALYQTAPISSVYALLERHLQIESSQNDDSWWAGGLMERLTKHTNKNDVSAASGAARDYAGFHKRVGKKLHFVYDLVGCESPFDSLRFVVDAVRPPQTRASFERDFGLPRFLAFEKYNERPAASVDFRHGVYD